MQTIFFSVFFLSINVYLLDNIQHQPIHKQFAKY